MTELDCGDFTAIIPTLNEVQNISVLVKKLKELYPNLKIIVSDDESSDGTQNAVLNLAKEYPDIQLLERKDLVHGLTASVIDAIKLVKTGYFFVMDADMQHPPEVVGGVLEKLKAGAEVVGAARIRKCENQGLHRILLTRLATKVASWALKGIKVSDPMSGFFGAQTELVQRAFLEHPNFYEPKGYKVFFDILRVMPKGLKYEEVHYQFAFRTMGRSKMSCKHILYFIHSLFRKQ